MSDIKQARVLLEAAERDYSAIRGMEDATIFADEIFGFHVQQALEKSLKALLALLGKTYPATHDLARLIKMLKAYDTEAERFDELVEYTSYAVQYRYGASDPSVTPLNRATAVQHTEALLEEVQRRLEGIEHQKEN